MLQTVTLIAIDVIQLAYRIEASTTQLGANVMAMQPQTALFQRAIHADGWKPDRDYWNNSGAMVAVSSVHQVLGTATHYAVDPDRAIWESLLTRQIIMDGGL